MERREEEWREAERDLGGSLRTEAVSWPIMPPFPYTLPSLFFSHYLSNKQKNEQKKEKKITHVHTHTCTHTHKPTRATRGDVREDLELSVPTDSMHTAPQTNEYMYSTLFLCLSLSLCTKNLQKGENK